MKFEYRIQRLFLDGRWMTLNRFGPWTEAELDVARRTTAEERSKLPRDKGDTIKLVGRIVSEWEDVPG